MVIASSTKSVSGDTVVFFKDQMEKTYKVTKTDKMQSIKTLDEFDTLQDAIKKFQKRVWE